MNTNPSSLPFERLFCGMILKAPVNASYSSEDLIKCQECGEHNDYDSLIEVVKEKAIRHAKEDMKNTMQNIFRKKR